MSKHLCCCAERWVPEEEAGPWSQMFFSYATSLIKLGKQKALRSEDLWDISYRDQASNVSEVHLNHHTCNAGEAVAQHAAVCIGSSTAHSHSCIPAVLLIPSGGGGSSKTGDCIAMPLIGDGSCSGGAAVCHPAGM